MNRVDRVFKQLEHIVNYEYDFYDTKEEIVNDLRKILNNEIVFINVGMDKTDMQVDLFIRYGKRLDVLKAFLKEKAIDNIDVDSLNFIQTRDKILDLFDYDYECLTYELGIFEREVIENGNEK